jgi:hypothetical protein
MPCKPIWTNSQPVTPQRPCRYSYAHVLLFHTPALSEIKLGPRRCSQACLHLVLRPGQFLVAEFSVSRVRLCLSAGFAIQSLPPSCALGAPFAENEEAGQPRLVMRAQCGSTVELGFADSKASTGRTNITQGQRSNGGPSQDARKTGETTMNGRYYTPHDDGF